MSVLLAQAGRTLPEDLMPIICDQYAAQRQLGSLAVLMRLNRRTADYARGCMYKTYDYIDDRTSRFLETAIDVGEAYDDGNELDEYLLAAIDCHELDPLDLDPTARWIRYMRMVETVVIRDMLYGRDISMLKTLVMSLANRGILLFPRLKEIVITKQVVRRICSVEVKFPPKQVPKDLLVLLFHGSTIKTLRVEDSTVFAPPIPMTGRAFGGPFTTTGVASAVNSIHGRYGPSERSHISHAIIQLLLESHDLRRVDYNNVDPFIPVRPKPGIRHNISFRPFTPPDITAPSSSSSSTSPQSSNPTMGWSVLHASVNRRPHRPPPPLPFRAPTGAEDERSYIWEIRQAALDIISRSVVPFGQRRGSERGGSHEEDEEEGQEITDDVDMRNDGEAGEADGHDRDHNAVEGHETRPRQQSSWHFILPFSPDSSDSASTLRLQVRDGVRRKYHDPDLMEEVLGRMTFEFADP